MEIGSLRSWKHDREHYGSLTLLLPFIEMTENNKQLFLAESSFQSVINAAPSLPSKLCSNFSPFSLVCLFCLFLLVAPAAAAWSTQRLLQEQETAALAHWFLLKTLGSDGQSGGVNSHSQLNSTLNIVPLSTNQIIISLLGALINAGNLWPNWMQRILHSASRVSVFLWDELVIPSLFNYKYIMDSSRCGGSRGDVTLLKRQNKTYWTVCVELHRLHHKHDESEKFNQDQWTSETLMSTWNRVKCHCITVEISWCYTAKLQTKPQNIR